MIEKVISGGQSGADLAGNEWARSKSIITVVRAYQNFKTYYLPDQKLCDSFRHEDYNLQHFYDPIEKLRRRTLLNVRNSDATLIFIGKPIEETRGSRLTARYCRDERKYFHVINLKNYKVESLIRFMNIAKPKVLNIAGERFIERKDVINMLDKYWELVGDERQAAVKS